MIAQLTIVAVLNWQSSPYIARSYIAMLREADNGTFDPDMWAPTFPALTDEVIEKVMNKAREALSHIPPVLGEIVLSYLLR